MAGFNPSYIFIHAWSGFHMDHWKQIAAKKINLRTINDLLQLSSCNKQTIKTFFVKHTNPVGYYLFSEEKFHFYSKIFSNLPFFFFTILKRNGALNWGNYVWECITCDGQWYKCFLQHILLWKWFFLKPYQRGGTATSLPAWTEIAVADKLVNNSTFFEIH